MRKRFIPFPIRLAIVCAWLGVIAVLESILAAVVAFAETISAGLGNITTVAVMAIADQKRFKSESRK
jgi:hypothetical protein